MLAVFDWLDHTLNSQEATKRGYGPVAQADMTVDTLLSSYKLPYHKRTTAKLIYD